MTQTYRLLVVEDDPIARDAAILGFGDVGFDCEAVDDGSAAQNALATAPFDAVVTDLRMPKKNGHSLAVELLARGPYRPLIFVLTGVLEPLLVRDLVARGVDDVSFKPIAMTVYAAKIHAICRRRLAQCRQVDEPAVDYSAPDSPVTSFVLQDLEQAVAEFASSLPRSSVVTTLANEASQSPNSLRVSDLIAADHELARESVRLAAYISGRSGRTITNLTEAAKQLGEPKLLEIALAAAAMLAVASYPNCDLKPNKLLRRGLANSIALEHIRSGARPGAIGDGQLFAALLAPWSETVLSLCCPDAYRSLVERSNLTGESLVSLERRFWPATSEQANAMLHHLWNVPNRFLEPLNTCGRSYAELANIPQPARSRAEFLRLAQQFGQLAVGGFEPCDEIDIPPIKLLEQLHFRDLSGQVQRFRADLAATNQVGFGNAASEEPVSAAQYLTFNRLKYFRLGSDEHDWIEAVSDAIGIQLEPVSRAVARQQEPVFVNCLNASPERVKALLNGASPNRRRVAICNEGVIVQPDAAITTITLPTSFGALLNGFRTASERRMT